MNIYSTLKRPLLSEKSNEQREQLGQYSFIVDRKASKTDVKKAVEKIFSVNVVKVSTAVTRGKYRRRGNRTYLDATKKKAIVSLSKGQKLDLFEDQ